MEDVNKLVCEDCGKVGGDVEETNCPYAEEVYGNVVSATLCYHCAHERWMDT